MSLLSTISASKPSTAMSSHRILSVFALLAVPLSLSLVGCDKEDPALQDKCDKLAKHMADVLISEYEGEVDDEARARMVDKSKEACVGEAPSDEQFDCAMKATTAKAIHACDDGAVNEAK